MTETLENLSETPLQLYRLAGDCFAVNFPGKYREDVLDFYDLVKREMEKYCTISAGVAIYSCGDEMDGGQVYQYAENALDRAKREGKNTLVFFSSDDYQKNLEKIALQDEMRASVRNGCNGFYLCYQPQIDTITGFTGPRPCSAMNPRPGEWWGPGSLSLCWSRAA